MSDAADQITDQVHAAIFAAMPDALAPAREALQEAVGIPVERVGGKEIRSKPGEYPRKDTGRLQSEVIVSVTESSDIVSASLAVDVPYAQPLKDSGRLLYGNQVEDRLPEICDAIADRITASNT